MKDAIIIVLSYLIGAISPGIILGKKLKGIDIRQHGSGNTGATNVLRTLGPAAAAIAFLIDALKGAVAVWLGSQTGNPLLPYLCGAAAIIGHNWPIYVGFKGGKGMATAAGIMFALFPSLAGILLGIWLLVVILTKYVSLASMLATIGVIPALILTKAHPREIAFGVFLAVIIVWRHKANIQRLLAGKESKIGQKVKVKDK